MSRARWRGPRVWAALVVLASIAPTAAGAKLTPPERSVLTRYLTALQLRNYANAFAGLSDDERRYFRSPRNLAAIFAADRLTLEGFTIVESTRVSAAATLAIVRERVTFFDHAHQRTGTITANVRYGIVPSAHGLGIKDPFHPWYAFAPADATASANGIRITVRKISFYTGRVEVLATFANTSDRTVTILPYGRSLVRDDAGKTHAPIRSKLPGLTDAALFEGLRLPPSGQYSGAMTFFTADRFKPKRLGITFGPALVDGADAPFEFVLPDIAVPGAG